MGYGKEYIDYMQKLVKDELLGFTIVQAVTTPDEEDGAFGFVALKNEVDENGKPVKTIKKIVWIDCDEEGNGPGFLNINEVD